MRHLGLIAAAAACAALVLAAPACAATAAGEAAQAATKAVRAPQPAKTATKARTAGAKSKASKARSSKAVKARSSKAAGTASGAKSPTSLRSVPTKIVSDRMTYEADRLSVTFSGGVHVVRDDMQMWADRLVVGLHPSKRAQGKAGGLVGGLDVGEIRSLLADGSVRMQSEGRTGRCARATYDVGKGLFVMSGDPTLQEPGRTLVGKEIHYYVREARSVVVGDKARRVEAVFLGPDPKRKGGR